MPSYALHTPAQLSAHLRSLRRTRGLTQAQLGAILDLDQTRIAKIEANPGAVSLEQLLKVLAALDAQMVLHPRGKTPAGSKQQEVDW